MIRPVLSYILSITILLSQTGLPVHMHYCKGMLESVSVFFSQGCDDHNEVADLPKCCQKSGDISCSAEGSDCCDDKVSILIQDIVSPIHHFDKWELTTTTTLNLPDPIITTVNQDISIILPGVNSDSGPPIYILHQALIFYA